MTRTRLTLSLFSLLLIPLSVLVVLSLEKSPGEKVSMAREAISDAREVGADKYAAGLFDAAEKRYDAAMEEWSAQNRKPIFLRDYDNAKSLADESRVNAMDAREEAMVGSAKRRKDLQDRLNLLRKNIGSFQGLFSSLPAGKNIRDENSRGRMAFSEAEIAYREGRFSACEEKLRESTKALEISYLWAGQLMDKYFEMWPEWSKWVEETIKSTRGSGQPAVVIDKVARKCYVYQNGNLTEVFDADLGRNWVGDKRERGDRATPEGMYKITEKKEGKNTSYYKALLIDYPNAEDRVRFSNDRGRGRLSPVADIGGLIEIHGKGGTGTDWTDGCIALSDHDMDILYRLCKKGTRVTIVGSVESLDEVKGGVNR